MKKVTVKTTFKTATSKQYLTLGIGDIAIHPQRYKDQQKHMEMNKVRALPSQWSSKFLFYSIKNMHVYI